MSKLKEQGNVAFKEKDFEKAVEIFSQAIKENPDDHTLWGNRSAAALKLGKSADALADAETCIDLKPDWARGWQRKAYALQALGRKEEALVAFEKGYDVDPTNTALIKEMSQLKVEVDSEK